MAILNLVQENKKIESFEAIKAFLNERSIFFDSWEILPLKDTDSEDEILNQYASFLNPYMQENGYKVADVININATTENYPELRKKFLAEHIHTEDEVRYFIDGEGLFWFHLQNGEVFNVLCQAGDLISVPAGEKHWFDAGEQPHVKVIRIFIDKSGWVPHYTDSKIETKFS